jgi:hypothetical protein
MYLALLQRQQPTVYGKREFFGVASGLCVEQKDER